MLGLVAGLWFTRRAPRTDRTRAALLLWGGWLVVTALVFSYMSGIIHPYYTVALAPGDRGHAGDLRARALARPGELRGPRGAGRDARGDRGLGLRASRAYAGLAAVAPLRAARARRGRRRWRCSSAPTGVRRFGPSWPRSASCGALLGTASFTLATAATAHSGGTPSSGPAVASGRGFGAARRLGSGCGEGRTDTAVIDLLKNTTTKWAAAQSGAMQSAGLALASGRPVLAIGGFSGSDPAPTLAQFRQYVAAGDIHYFVAGGRGGFGGGRGTSGQIQTWVEQNFAPGDRRRHDDLRPHEIDRLTEIGVRDGMFQAC